MKKKKVTTDALKIMDALWGKEPGWKEGIEEERRKFALGELIRENREVRGLTQKQLARRAKTSQSAISRIEDADYEGLKVETLTRIARALGVPFGVTLGKRSVTLQPPELKANALQRV